MKMPFLIISLSLYIQIQAQEEIPKFEILAGPQIKVTPVYLKKVPGIIHIGNINVLEQPGEYLAGFGICLTEKLYIDNNWSLLFCQTIRRDRVYDRLPLSRPPPPEFKYGQVKKTIFDFYTDIGKKLDSERESYFILTAGTGLCGINTDFYQVRRVYSGNGYFEYTEKKNFMFPVISTGINWKWKDLSAGIKLSYCWSDPTFFNTPFLSATLNLLYSIYTWNRKKGMGL